MSTAESPHRDNITFTQTSSTTWDVTTTTGVLLGRVEKAGKVFTAFDQDNMRIGDYDTAESGMFALVPGPVL